jgi:PAS domain S-box-containing protein
MLPVRASLPSNPHSPDAAGGESFEGGAGMLRRYRAMAGQLPRGAVFIVDTELRYLLAAGPAFRLSGFAPDDFEGRLLSEALPPDLVAQHTEDYLAILAGGTMLREHCSGGVWYESHGLPLTDARGRIRAALVVSRDITTRRRQAESLQVLDRLARAIAAETDPLAIADAAAGLLEAYFGPVRCVIARLDAEDEPADIDGIALAQFGPDVPARLAQGETVASGEGVDTSGLPVRSFLLCPHLAGGKLAGVTAILSGAPLAWCGEDRAFVCEAAGRAWNHIDRLRLLDALRETGRRKDGLLPLLAQELRNPMTVVRNSLALLGRPGTAVLPQAVLALVERQFGYMNRIVEDALDTSYIADRPAALRCHRLSLQDAVLAVVEAARTLVPVQTHALSLSMPPEAIAIWADPIRLAQALSNVLANALKYAWAPVRVSVAVERRGAQALVRVADNGIGMSRTTLAHLSAMLGRAGSGAPPAGGLGVGLWIASRVVEAHGGKMEADSAGPDLGSTITITLPVQELH